MTNGVWLVYYADFSAAAVFDLELDALRHAVQNGMSAKYVGWGEDLLEAVSR